MDKPQVIVHTEKSVNYSLFDTRWIPCSARFVTMGTSPRGTGKIDVYEVVDGVVTLRKEIEKSHGFRCGTFGASRLAQRHLATGDFDGKLHVWDLEQTATPVFSADAHTEIINCIDGVGGVGKNVGPCEIATGSRDGSVKVWDVRQQRPVAVMAPREGEPRRDCWAVAFGNSCSGTDRVLAAGYDNGDVKLFDLAAMSLLWETSARNGVCGMQFDRADIAMNKMVVATLEGRFLLYDMRTRHPARGFAHLAEKAHKSTVWLCRHLPQDREIFVTSGGAGSLMLWKYCYPGKRFKEDSEGVAEGVVGSVELLANNTISSQPIAGFDWSPDKLGLAVATGFDQTLRLIIVTKLNLC